MTEIEACALLKARFVKAGFQIHENVPFDEDGVRFEIDGFDAGKRVGYEYLTEEAGDGWDVDGALIAALEARRDAGELFILVVDEHDAPDPKTLGAAADVFLEQLRELDEEDDEKPAAKPAAKTKKPAGAAKKSPTKKPDASKTPRSKTRKS